MTKAGERARIDDIPDPIMDTPTRPPAHSPWSPGRKYEGFGFIRTLLDFFGVVLFLAGAAGAIIAFLPANGGDVATATVLCLSGVFGAVLFGGFSIALVILRDIAHDQRRAALEAHRTAEAMERIANRNRGG